MPAAPRRAVVLLALLGICSPLAGAGAPERVLTVFAAASLTEVMEELGAAYAARAGGMPVRFSFAGSSTLARQIETGAPAQVFISADQQWLDYLVTRQLVQQQTRTDVAGNTLVLVAPADSKLQLGIAPGFALRAALGRNGRLALADPDTVPAGRYAREALGSLGVWDDIATRIVAADSVRTALNFVALGEAPLGIVYATDVRGNARVRVVGTFPAATHTPITYPAAATARGGEDGARFVAFLASDVARAIFTRHGFSLPRSTR